MIRRLIACPAHLRTLARVDGEVQLDVDGAGDAALGARRARGALSGAARHDPRPRHAASAGRSCASSRASRICRTSRPTPAARGGGHGRGTVPRDRSACRRGNVGSTGFYRVHGAAAVERLSLSPLFSGLRRAGEIVRGVDQRDM